ncbi:MAG: lysozyme [Bacteroidales bacterium]
MKIGNKGIELIKNFEGFSSTAYRCPAGILTIGYGHTRNVSCSQVISKLQAEDLLRIDIIDAEQAVTRLVNKKLTQNQFDALVSFAFNCGIGNLIKSTLLKKVNINPSDSSIAYEFNRWNKANGNVLKGLTRRREAEANLYFS